MFAEEPTHSEELGPPREDGAGLGVGQAPVMTPG